MALPQSLDADVQFLRGVGPERAQLLDKLGINTLEDLLWYLPRDILDFSNIRLPQDLQDGELSTVRGTVYDADARNVGRNRMMSKVILDCGTDFVRGVWFNQPWMLKRLPLGQQVLFSGKPKFREGRFEFSHPTVQLLAEDEFAEASQLIFTRYRLTEGLRVGDLRTIIGNGLMSCEHLIADPLPRELLDRLQLPSLLEALKGVHQPRTADEFHRCRQRIIFDDLYEFQLGIALRRRAWRNRLNAPVLERTAKIDARIRRLFPFDYTSGQNKAVKEIASDLKSGYAMHRLLQADVGAGKTVVALDTMLTAIAHGWQAAVMAPTELLATQHWQTVETALIESRVKRVLLTGSLTARERREALSGIADGSIQLVVGTQALIQKDVKYFNLGVIVIDEQHKFGVAQRATFSNLDGNVPPHVLVMTATPIPRTVCMTQFGDLDLTLVKDRPPGRQPVITSKILGPTARAKAFQFLADQLRSGRQLYVVCPLVESADDNEPGNAAAEQVYRSLKENEFADFRVGMVHGRMKRDERDDTMDAFRDHELDVLVATTVIEVGVDVPNATLMVILDAEKFGLSQLHQLRGRVARGKYRGYCFLFSESESSEASARLAVLERSSDGFEVAEQDFELRGPGDVLGTRQHGALPLRYVHFLREEKILEKAQVEANLVVQSGVFDTPEYAPLKQRVLERFSLLMELPHSG
ncbi:ATP-dependent DNA helicase RecG [Planctomicrobium sp. SH668]|uniref:ATP-dependent DNA helicase RecG n=1 Tax=Planctomicrobium sp. SH668 TaxID=3448126 RepID=UPI003F5ADECC